MNILYVVTKKQNDNCSNETIESIIPTANYKDTDSYLVKNFTEEEYDKQLYYSIKDEIETKNIDYVVIVPNNSILCDNYREVVEEYVTSGNKVYLPFCLLKTDGETKGLLNTCVWTNHALEVSKLDHELSLGQTDTVLYGALISKDLFFDEKNYNKDLKFFQHFHFLNSITDNEANEVIGIPKLLLNLNYDLTFNNIDKEEKITNYKLAREKFVKALNEPETV